MLGQFQDDISRASEQTLERLCNLEERLRCVSIERNPACPSKGQEAIPLPPVLDQMRTTLVRVQTANEILERMISNLEL